MTTRRKAGWYWVKFGEGDDWECKRLISNGYWASHDGVMDREPSEIGPRIPTPDEPCQCVPVEPTPEMIDHGAQAIVSWDEGCTWPDSWGADAARHRHDCCKAYRAMLAAAPKPKE